MSNEEKIEYKGIVRKELTLPILGVIGSLVITLTTFYFNTNNSISDLEEKVNELQGEIKSKANADEVKEKIYNLHQDVRDLQATNQKILEILLERDKK
jgi:uncharacterized membrane protein (DUF106 family)